MQKGNWIPLDKRLVKFLPKLRKFEELEAAFSVSLDYDCGNEVTVSGYASTWGWSRKRVNAFLERLGVEISYPENTAKKRNQKGHIALHKRDIKGTYKEHIRMIDSRDIAKPGNIKGAYKGHKRDIKGSTTINPISLNPNPDPKKNKDSACLKAFENWWLSYPKRKGRKIGKEKTSVLFRKIPKEELENLKTATANYSRECNGYPKDPERFLRNDFWRDYVNKQTRTPGSAYDPEYAAMLKEESK